MSSYLAASEQPLADELSTDHYTLLPMTAGHHQAIHRLANQEWAAFKWRYRAGIPSFPVFERTLYAGVLTQFVITGNEHPTNIVGVLIAHDFNAQDQHCVMSTVFDSCHSGPVEETIPLFIKYLFRYWSLRKMYVEVSDFNRVPYHSACVAGLVKEEARLKHHIYFDDKYWDQVTYAVYPDSVEKLYIYFLRSTAE